MHLWLHVRISCQKSKSVAAWVDDQIQTPNVSRCGTAAACHETVRGSVLQRLHERIEHYRTSAATVAALTLRWKIRQVALDKYLKLCEGFRLWVEWFSIGQQSGNFQTWRRAGHQDASSRADFEGVCATVSCPRGASGFWNLNQKHKRRVPQEGPMGSDKKSVSCMPPLWP